MRTLLNITIITTTLSLTACANYYPYHSYPNQVTPIRVTPIRAIPIRIIKILLAIQATKIPWLARLSERSLAPS